MKRFVSIIKRMPKRVAFIAAIAVAVIAIPLHSMAAADVLMEGSIGVANQTTGQTTYQEQTNASYDQVVKFQVFYHNRELPDSGNIAKNFKVKVNMPTQAGTNQVVNVTMGGDNTNTITDTATVVLNRSDASLEFIPGSVYWRHNVGTRSNINDVTQNIPDSTILNGTVLEENLQPCHEFEATLTFMARVRVPSVGVTKVVRKKGDTNKGITQLAANPGERLEYMLTGKNLGNATLTHMTLRDALPAQVKFVPGTVKLFNGTNPNGAVINNDYLFHGGVDAGNVGPGASVYISFEADLASVDQLQCGSNEAKNIVVVKTGQTGEYNNSATVTTTKKCDTQPTYSCDLLDVQTADGRKVTADVKYTAKNGASFKTATFDFGDGTSPMVTTNTTVNHTYAADGEYKISTNLLFSVNGTDKIVTSENCTKSVQFASSKPVPPVTPATPTELPNTGAGDVIGIFAATTIAGALVHRFVLSRRFQS